MDELLGEIISENPSWGEKMLHGRLESMGLRVRRDTLRQSMKRVDPAGV